MLQHPGSRGEYERRIHRVLEHIDAHLDQPLPLDELAAVANFSAFHFHRLFTAWSGETVGDYLRRRRVETAAWRLMGQPRLTVLQAALAVGFGSGEAFARAFRQRFGASPSLWRRQRSSKTSQVLGKLDQAEPAAGREHRDFAMQPGAPMNVKLIERLPTAVAYFRYIGPLGAPVGEFWTDKVAPWMAENSLSGRTRYGIAHDDPQITDASKCRYDAAVELPLDAVVSGQPHRTTLPGGRYACMPFKGNGRDIDDAWNRLLREWLPDSGLQLDARPCLEHYAPQASFDEKTGTFECEICIPVCAL